MEWLSEIHRHTQLPVRSRTWTALTVGRRMSKDIIISLQQHKNQRAPLHIIAFLVLNSSWSTKI